MAVARPALPVQPAYVVVGTDTFVVADRGRAALLRERYLDTLRVEEGQPVWIDLNRIQVMTVGAGDELIARWIERVRSPRHPVVLVLATRVEEVRDTLHTVLAAARQAAYRVSSAPFSEHPTVIGDITPGQFDTLRDLSEHGSATSREFAERNEMGQSAALNRLGEIYERGLVLLEWEGGARKYVYPWPNALDPEQVKRMAAAPSGRRR